MLRVDLARVRLSLIISLPPKKTAPVFFAFLVCIVFLSAFGDIIQTKKQWLWMKISNYFIGASMMFFSSGASSATDSSSEHKIRADLLRNYDRKVRPVREGKRSVEVQFGMKVSRLVKVVRLVSVAILAFILS